MSMESRTISKKRVADHGEVLTGKREVDAMLDLVRPELERLESRFLEPACGDGNFVAEILRRKLSVVEKKYGSSQFDFERNAIIAVASIYGIDILEDNVRACRDRLFKVFDSEFYTRIFGSRARERCQESARFILRRNVIHGDALTLQTVGDSSGPIVFSEWSPINGSLMKRRDFSFHSLVEREDMMNLPLFSDLGEEVFLPTPEREFPPIHFLDIANAE